MQKTSFWDFEIFFVNFYILKNIIYIYIYISLIYIYILKNIKELLYIKEYAVKK